LITILVVTQVLNAVLLLPLLVWMLGVARDRDVMGPYRVGRREQAVYVATIAMVACCVSALLVLQLLPGDE
jgi:Mn2+/Fe2+ NRAMP family transporter